MVYTLTNEQEMHGLAARYTDVALGGNEKKPVVFGLVGELGAGKTTFVRGMLRHLGVEEHVTSPTFLIKKEYMLPTQFFGKDRVVHVDAYRVDEPSELTAVGVVDDLSDSTAITVIEWADRVVAALPPYTYWLAFQASEKGVRRVKEGKEAIDTND